MQKIMILAFKIEKNEKLKKVIKELKQRYRQPNTPYEIANKPYMNPIIKIRKNILIIKIELIYKYINPIIYLLTKTIDNKIIFYLAIKQIMRKHEYKQAKLISNQKLIEELI